MFEILMRRAFGPPFNQARQLQVIKAYQHFLNNYQESLSKIDMEEPHTHLVVSYLRIAIQQFFKWPSTDAEKAALTELNEGLEHANCEGDIYYAIDEMLVLTERLKRISIMLTPVF